MNDNRNFVELNIELSAEFSRYLFDHPEFSDRIPSDAEIILVPEFDMELRDYNLSLGRTSKRKEKRSPTSALRAFIRKLIPACPRWN